MGSTVAEIIRVELPLQLFQLRRAIVSMPAAVDGAEMDLNRILGVCAKFDRDVDAAGADVNLSPQGKGDAAAKAARVALASLDDFAKSNIGGLDANIASVSDAIMPAPKPSRDVGDRIVGELRDAEIRSHFRGMDQVEATLLFLSTDDPIVRAALADAPPVPVRLRPGELPVWQRLVDPQRVADAELAAAEVRDPEAAAQLRDLHLLVRVYRATVATARHGILEVVPAVRPAPAGA